jgi:hypothetical protein
VADAVSLAQHTDGVVLFVPRGAQVRHIEAARQRLAVLRIPLLGFVYCGAPRDARALAA